MRTSAALASLLLMTATAQAETVEEFYKGKTITLAIGFSAGGGYDLYARHLARHMARHIPGLPTIVPQNMAGAGSLRVANFLATAAPKDGTVFGTFTRTTAIINPLLDMGGSFDGSRFTWLGSVTDDVSLCITWHTTGVKTWQDFISRPTALGAEGPGSEPDMFARLHKNVFGAPIRMVTGYPGTNEITLAMERGEVDGLCSLSWSTIKSRHAQWLKDKKINLISQASFRKAPELGDVPLVAEQTKDPEKLQLLKLFMVTQEMGRPFAAPPGIPADRKAALVAAFDATMKDPDYLAEAATLGLDVNPVNGKTIDALLAEVYATPKEVLKKAREAVTK